MTAFIPTHRVDILRGTTEDAYGDEADTEAVAAYNVPVAITEAGRAGTSTARSERGPASTTPRTVGRLSGRFRPRTDVRNGDRLRVAGAGAVYRVVGVGTPPDVVGLPDVVADLVRVTAAG